MNLIHKISWRNIVNQTVESTLWFILLSILYANGMNLVAPRLITSETAAYNPVVAVPAIVFLALALLLTERRRDSK